jgi:hypothetical protein
MKKSGQILRTVIQAYTGQVSLIPFSPLPLAGSVCMKITTKFRDDKESLSFSCCTDTTWSCLFPIHLPTFVVSFPELGSHKKKRMNFKEYNEIAHQSRGSHGNRSRWPSQGFNPIQSRAWRIMEMKPSPTTFPQTQVAAPYANHRFNISRSVPES